MAPYRWHNRGTNKEECAQILTLAAAVADTWTALEGKTLEGVMEELGRAVKHREPKTESSGAVDAMLLADIKLLMPLDSVPSPSQRQLLAELFLLERYSFEKVCVLKSARLLVPSLQLTPAMVKAFADKDAKPAEVNFGRAKLSARLLKPPQGF